MMLAAIVLLGLAGLYLLVENGEGGTDRVLRWMVLIGAAGLALLVGGGALS